MPERASKRRKVNDQDGPRVADPRFANIQSDPRYRLPSKKHKVKLDKRFAQKFKQEDFTRRAKVDRYGRRIDNRAEQQRLQAKFDLEDDEPDDDDQVQAELARLEKTFDPLRQGRDVSSSDDDSSTDDDSESEAENLEEIELVAEDEDVPLGEVSTRIAVVNLDWENIRAIDLMAVFSSFLPAGGRLLEVTVYPSEFGKERIEREEMEGPPKEIFAQNANVNEDERDLDAQDEVEDDDDIKASIIKPDDGSEFDSQALRQYQLERLRYYYAVLTFSSKQTAKSIYDAVDGTEYLSTANFFDLRFVPENMDFSSDNPRDNCNRLPSGYQPNEFVTDALQHSKVKLTWDADDRTRKEAQARAFKGGRQEIDENDLKAYLGSDTSEDEEDDVEEGGMAKLTETTTSKKDKERQKARALLGLAPEPAKRSNKTDKDVNRNIGDIQITFSSGLSGAADGNGKKRSVFENSPEPQETTVEKYKRKEKERKQLRKEKMRAARQGDKVATEADGEGETAIDETQDDDLGFDDPFFAETGESARQTSKVRKEERLKRRREKEAEEAASVQQRAELELLMADNDNEAAQQSGVAAAGRAVKHFDMNEIEKAEKGKNKWQKRKDKKNKKKHGDDETSPGAGLSVQDDFKLDTTDARFGSLFQNHEFAIDPTRPGLRQTKAMKELVEEGRRRKQKELKSERLNSSSHKISAAEQSRKIVESAASNEKQPMNGELRDLVAKIKRKGGD